MSSISVRADETYAISSPSLTPSQKRWVPANGATSYGKGKSLDPTFSFEPSYHQGKGPKGKNGKGKSHETSSDVPSAYRKFLR